MAAGILGHRHPVDVDRLTRRFDAWATSPRLTSVSGLVLLLLALLLAAATLLHTADLARALGFDHTGPLNPQTGWALTCLLQGQTHLIPLTTRWPTPP